MTSWNDDALTAAETVETPSPELVADLTAEIRRLQMREKYLNTQITVLLSINTQPPFWKDGATDAIDQRSPRSESAVYRRGYDVVSAIVNRHNKNCPE